MLNNLSAFLSMCRGGFFLWFQQIQGYVLQAAKILIKLEAIHSDIQVHFINRQHREVVGISLDANTK